MCFVHTYGDIWGYVWVNTDMPSLGRLEEPCCV